MDLRLKGKVAVVTGGSLGIGRAVAQALAEEGVHVALISRGREALERAAAEIAQATGVKTLAVPVDVSDTAGVQAAMGTIAAERVLDGLFVAMLLVGTLAFIPRLPLDGVVFLGFPVARVVQYGYASFGLFSSALAVLAVFLVARNFAETATLKVVGLVSRGLAERLSRMVGGLADGLRSLPDPKLMGPFMLQTAIYWSVNALGMWFLGWGCGLPMTPGHGFAVMGVLAIGILLPQGPGLFGTFQVFVYLALRMYFPEDMIRERGVAYVFLLYASQFVFTLVTGFGAMAVGHIDPRSALNDESPPRAA